MHNGAANLMANREKLEIVARAWLWRYDKPAECAYLDESGCKLLRGFAAREAAAGECRVDQADAAALFVGAQVLTLGAPSYVLPPSTRWFRADDEAVAAHGRHRDRLAATGCARPLRGARSTGAARRRRELPPAYQHGLTRFHRRPSPAAGLPTARTAARGGGRCARRGGDAGRRALPAPGRSRRARQRSPGPVDAPGKGTRMTVWSGPAMRRRPRPSARAPPRTSCIRYAHSLPLTRSTLDEVPSLRDTQHRTKKTHRNDGTLVQRLVH